jgi:hypothetical protein
VSSSASSGWSFGSGFQGSRERLAERAGPRRSRQSRRYRDGGSSKCRCSRGDDLLCGRNLGDHRPETREEQGADVERASNGTLDLPVHHRRPWGSVVGRRQSTSGRYRPSPRVRKTAIRKRTADRDSAHRPSPGRVLHGPDFNPPYADILIDDKNAVEAMSLVKEGARELSISTNHGQRSDILVAVQDSGPGIMPPRTCSCFRAGPTRSVSSCSKRSPAACQSRHFRSEDRAM